MCSLNFKIVCMCVEGGGRGKYKCKINQFVSVNIISNYFINDFKTFSFSFHGLFIDDFENSLFSFHWRCTEFQGNKY